jgi:hypothetical protein
MVVTDPPGPCSSALAGAGAGAGAAAPCGDWVVDRDGLVAGGDGTGAAADGDEPDGNPEGVWNGAALAEVPGRALAVRTAMPLLQPVTARRETTSAATTRVAWRTAAELRGCDRRARPTYRRHPRARIPPQCPFLACARAIISSTTSVFASAYCCVCFQSRSASRLLVVAYRSRSLSLARNRSPSAARIRSASRANSRGHSGSLIWIWPRPRRESSTCRRSGR